MDPQLRLFLETAYESIVDAGYEPSTLRRLVHLCCFFRKFSQVFDAPKYLAKF